MEAIRTGPVMRPVASSRCSCADGRASMLRNLKLDKYRSFDEYELSNLSRVNLLVGKNDCGKASILEAIHFLVSRGDPMVSCRVRGSAWGRRGCGATERGSVAGRELDPDPGKSVRASPASSSVTVSHRARPCEFPARGTGALQSGSVSPTKPATWISPGRFPSTRSGGPSATRCTSTRRMFRWLSNRTSRCDDDGDRKRTIRSSCGGARRPARNRTLAPPSRHRPRPRRPPGARDPAGARAATGVAAGRCLRGARLAGLDLSVLAGRAEGGGQQERRQARRR